MGLVGRVPAHVLNKFQRDRNVDLDFFNGASADPGEDEPLAERADWEFVPLPEAVEKAGWEVTEADEVGDEADDGTEPPE
ncbi:hypothetical protein [Halorussus caseinilyticus]|uniref:hypothetical protein n=1 Tax=Halorussus caseinilyticus TaxID=3034025 RepID=UPI0023E82175|nr:hypothetical protein [Halorussus sp. DT72]